MGPGVRKSKISLARSARLDKMTVKQIVLGVKNRQGELSRIIGHLYENDVRVCAFWAGTENKKATLRFIASDPEAAISVLTGLGLKAKTMDDALASSLALYRAMLEAARFLTELIHTTVDLIERKTPCRKLSTD